MVKWTDETVETAVRRFMNFSKNAEIPKSDIHDMRAALDAAVKAQGLEDDLIDKDIRELMATPVDLFRAKCRAEALEEAARLLDGSSATYSFPILAADIRALKDKHANQTDGGE